MGMCGDDSAGRVLPLDLSNTTCGRILVSYELGIE
jgi:hypothetical protein